ncbi:MAG: high-affinity iron transporter [Acidimicrobiaceae bacterium]|jgi:high-affinity iron transporter
MFNARRLAPWLLALLIAAGALAFTAPAAEAAPAQTAAVSQTDAIRQLDVVRQSIDRTLALIKDGKVDEAFAEAKSGYLSHFELVEVPLRVADAQLTSDAETKFAEIRGLISSHADVSEVRSNIIELRAMIDDAERRLTDTGLSAPAVVFGQSFLIIFREGLEAVLLISVLLGYLEAAKATQYRRPILWGMAGAVAATVVTFFVLRTVLSALPFGREILEAVTAMLAVVVLFYVSFWLIARLEQKRWLEFLRARVWTAISVGSTAALAMVGFTAVYREGFETALFYQALLSFGPGLGKWVAAGLAAGIVTLSVVAWVIFRLGRRVPIKAFLSSAVVLLMATSVAFLGNAVRSLQEADVIRLHRWPGWPRAPIFLSQSLGYWPSRETLSAQAGLIAIYAAGAFYMFVVRPRRRSSDGEPAVDASSSEASSATMVPVDAHR